MAEKNRVYEIAKTHGITSKDLLSVVEELGVVAKSHMSVLTDEDLELVENHFSSVEAEGGKVVEVTQRIEVEKARPKARRMSAREKLEARRRDQKEAALKKADEPGSAADAAVGSAESAPKVEKPAPKLHKVKAFKPETSAEGASPTVDAPEKPAEKVAQALPYSWPLKMPTPPTIKPMWAMILARVIQPPIDVTNSSSVDTDKRDGRVQMRVWTVSTAIRTSTTVRSVSMGKPSSRINPALR